MKVAFFGALPCAYGTELAGPRQTLAYMSMLTGLTITRTSFATNLATPPTSEMGERSRLKGLEAVTIKSKRKTAMLIAVFDVLIV